MNSVNNHKSNYDHSLSFDDVSKLFSLPLSEAADILGVSTSVLKKLCNDNGLERWPHRKYLAGKSIEDIKKEATKEKIKASGGISQRQKGNVTTGSAALSSPAVKDKNARSTPEIPKSTNNAEQSGNRSVITWRHHVLASSLTTETSSCLDEVKYGFPASGLSRSSNKWWGSGSANQDDSSNHDIKSGSEVKHASETEVGEEKPNISTVDLASDIQERVSLSSVRKRALDEGQKALNLIVFKKYKVDKLGREEQTLLRRLFQTS